jgi:hypothetical protein
MTSLSHCISMRLALFTCKYMQTTLFPTLRGEDATANHINSLQGMRIAHL